MNRLAKMLAKLYPKCWRSRYEAEFEALLDEVKQSWRGALDILKGAISMQLRMWSSGKIVGVGAVAGLIVGLGCWLVMPNQYASLALVRIPACCDASTADGRERLDSLMRFLLSRSTLSTMSQVHGLYPVELKKMPLEEVLQKMKQGIQIRPATLGELSSRRAFQAIQIEFVYPDAALAQRRQRSGGALQLGSTGSR
jgi:hypothetical protein